MPNYKIDANFGGGDGLKNTFCLFISKTCLQGEKSVGRPAIQRRLAAEPGSVVYRGAQFRGTIRLLSPAFPRRVGRGNLISVYDSIFVSRWLLVQLQNI